MVREFDLSTQVSAQLKVLWSLLGIVQIANGVFHIAGGEHLVLGAITICSGLLVLPGSFLLKRMNRFDGKSVTEISKALRITDARILYHLKRLAEIEVVHLEKREVGVEEWYCSPIAGTIRVREPLSTKNKDSEAIPENVVDQFNQAFLEAAEGLYGSVFPMSVNHNRSRLSEQQASEFNQRLLALIEEYFPPGKGDQSGVKYGFYGFFTPIDLHPLNQVKDEK